MPWVDIYQTIPRDNVILSDTRKNIVFKLDKDNNACSTRLLKVIDLTRLFRAEAAEVAFTCGLPGMGA